MNSIARRLGAATLALLAASTLALAGATAANADDAVGVADDYYATQGLPFVVEIPGVLANDVCAGTKSVYDIQPNTGEAELLTNGRLQYYAAPDFVGTKSFDYAWKCDDVAVPGFTHVTITYSPAPPVGVADFYSTPEGKELQVPAPGLLANDTNGVAVVDIQNLPDGLIAELDGSFIYTPPAGTLGDVTFSYRLSNGNDTLSDWIPVTITVTPVDIVSTGTSDDGTTLANTGETFGWLLLPSLALLVAGLATLLFANRRTDLLDI